MTVKDIARLAGVSTATVSRVFAASGAVSDKTAAAVHAAAEKVGYRPNVLGRNLRRRRTGIILVMLVSIENTFCAKVIRGIEKCAGEAGYTVMICASGSSREQELKYLDFAKDRLCDGVIILNGMLTSSDIASLSLTVQTVQCSEYPDEYTTPFVSIDNEAAAYDCVSYLIGKGRRSIAFISAQTSITPRCGCGMTATGGRLPKTTFQLTGRSS